MANVNNNDVAWWTKGKANQGNVRKVTIREDFALLKRFILDIAKSVGSIKMSLLSLVKSQEAEQKERKIERQRQRTSDYAARYKKVKPTREDKKVITSDQKSFFDIIKEGLSSIFKFAFLGLAAIGLSKLLNLPGVMVGIKKFFLNVILTFADLIKKGADLISELLNNKEIIKSITDVFKSIFTFVANGIQKASDLFKTIVADPKNQGSLVKIIKSVIEAVFSGFMAVLDVSGNLISQNKQSIVDGLVKIFVKISEGIVGAIKFTTDLLKDQQFRDSIAKIYLAIKDFITTILNEDIPGTNLTFKQGLIVLGLGFLAVEAALAYFTGALIARAVTGSGGGALPGKGKFTVSAAGIVIGAGGAISGREIYDAFFKVKNDPNTLKDFGSGEDANQVRTDFSSTPSSVPSDSSTPIQITNTGGTVNPSALLDLIASKESGKVGYDAANRGIAGDTPRGYPGLSKLTVGQVMDLQAKTSPRVLFAAGKYQIIPDTLKGLVAMGAAKRSDVFDAATQDKLAMVLINRRLDLAKKAGNTPEMQQLELAKEFASIAVPIDVVNIFGKRIKAGQSYYEGDAKNTAAITTQQIQAALGNKVSPGSIPGQMIAGEGEGKPYSITNTASNDLSSKPYPEQTVASASSPTSAPSIRNLAGRAASFGQTIQDTLASLVSTGPGSDFLRKLDEMTGGKLGIASGELATALRTRNLFFDNQEDTIIDASRTLASTSSNQWEGPIPSVYDETLLEKFKVV
jgi:hypothetical protein